MLAESEMERQRWVGALNELQKLLRRNKLPFKFVSTDLIFGYKHNLSVLTMYELDIYQVHLSKAAKCFQNIV